MFFETEKLIARELNMSDLPAFVEMQSNINVMRYITGIPKTKGESIKELVKIVHSYRKTNRDFLIMAVARKDAIKFIGTCAIIKNSNGEFEIGYRFIEEYWGNGYGKEIACGLVEFAFQALNLNQIVAYVNKDNYPSIRILESSSFDFIREYRESETGNLGVYYKISKPGCKD